MKYDYDNLCFVLGWSWEDDSPSARLGEFSTVMLPPVLTDNYYESTIICTGARGICDHYRVGEL